MLSGVIPNSTYLVDTSPFGSSFTAGILVTAVDLNGDRREEIAAAPGSGTPQVNIYGNTGSLTPTTIDSFFALSSFAGGLRLGSADFDPEGIPDLLVAPAPAPAR